MKRFLVMLVWGVAACGRLSVDDGRGAVTGQVLGRDGAPAVNARVMLIQARRPVAEGRSDAAGRFTVTGPSGSSALFALVNDSSDEGVYRGDVEVLPTGTTDVGELRSTVVWAFPDALWLRDTGFDEQAGEGRVVGELEAAPAVRGEAMGLPDRLHRRGRDAGGLRHRAQRPVRRLMRRRRRRDVLLHGRRHRCHVLRLLHGGRRRGVVCGG
jgi:hypothetical protein